MANTVTSAASTTWHGDLLSGAGETRLDTSAAATFPVKWETRSAAVGATTNPEELIAAALSTCYSMALSLALANNGTPPTTVNTTAKVSFQAGVGITGIALTTAATVAQISPEAFAQIAAETKTGCPVGAALAGVEITLSATLQA